jgi:dynein heavy chain
MEKMKHVSPHSLDGDAGWQIRDLYSECMKELDKSVDRRLFHNLK